MKIQCDVDEQVWRAGRVFSLESGQSMGEVVTDALKGFLQDRVGPSMGEPKKASPKPISGESGGLGVGSADGDAQRSGAIPQAKTVKAQVAPVASESKPPTPSPYKFTTETCPKHYYVDNPNGYGKKCLKCGFEP